MPRRPLSLTMLAERETPTSQAVDVEGGAAPARTRDGEFSCIAGHALP